MPARCTDLVPLRPAGRHRIGCPFRLSAGPARPGVTSLRAAKGAVRPTPGALNGAARPLPPGSGRAHAGSTAPLPRRPVPPRRKATAMKIKFTRAPTITKAATATILFTILRGVTDVNLPSCSDPGAVLNSGGCLVHQSYLHIACGWLALASLITGVVLFILKQRKASSQDQQAPPRPARSGVPGPGEAPGPAETTGPEERTHGDGTGPVTALAGPSGISRSRAGFELLYPVRHARRRGRQLLPAARDSRENGTASYPRNSVTARGKQPRHHVREGRAGQTRRPWPPSCFPTR